MEHQKLSVIHSWGYESARDTQTSLMNKRQTGERWSDRERGEEANRKVIFIFVSSVIYIYLWFWLWLPSRSHFEWWRDSLYPGISSDYLPSAWCIGTDGWQLFFFMNTFGKSHLPLLFHAQWQRIRKCTKETSTLICMKTAIFIWVCSSTELRRLITQKRGKQKWNAIMPLRAQYPELWSFCI